MTFVLFQLTFIHMKMSVIIAVMREAKKNKNTEVAKDNKRKICPEAAFCLHIVKPLIKDTQQ